MQNEKFTELLTKHLSSEISEDELIEFEQLLASDEANRQQYEFFKNYWKQEDRHYANSDLMFQKIKSRIIVEGDKEIEETTPEATKVRSIFRFWRKIAAILVLAIGIGAIYYWHSATGLFKKDGKSNLQVTATKSREKSVITLTDGTRVTLNSESKLSYPPSFDGATREVYLSGEAFFDVHKDHQHPFIIHTGKMNVRVLGTAFNVKAYPNDVVSETTLIRGSIQVTMADRPSDIIILKPKDKLIIENNNVKKPAPEANKSVAATNDAIAAPQYALTSLTYFKNQDTLVVETSWVNNKLVFRNEDFAALAQKMQRWYGVNIIFKNEEVKGYRFTAIFEKESINQALDALRITENFHYKLKIQPFISINIHKKINY